ncbi:hypothetical protein CIW83_05510 [Tissierella sp. P1]|uniref:methyltransferase domain-containing protein n=1 Tax=Tissierella sp. P1 TaxID=1280483 RepID=UPI000BA1001A|nr:methyltransferase domain-containing protein [Tissierella sp. P1]OZV13004.1 hypothetical protein CIW83_05510 [Tissierella sp. P1]
MKTGSYNANLYNEIRVKKEINRLIEGIENDKINMYNCLSLMNFGDGDKVLDLGCGPGGTTKKIAEFNNKIKVYGVDREPRYIAYADGSSAGNPNITFLESDCSNTKFEDNYFDASFSRFVFQHLYKPELAMRELIRVTKNGGKIGIYEWDEGLTCFSKAPKLYSKYLKAENTRRRFTDGDLYFGRKLYSMFRNFGLENIKVKQLFNDVISPGREILKKGQLWGEEPNENHTYVKLGLMTLEEIKQYYEELEEIIDNENEYVSYGSFFVVGEVVKHE